MENLRHVCESDPNIKAYLSDKVFPVLTDGLEALLKAIDDRKKNSESLPEIEPILFLAQYLIRNNPNV